MANYLSPAVYIEEKSSGIKPIEGVGTSTAAFIGHAEMGPIGEAVPIKNFSEFQKKFGGYIEDGYLAFAVKAFFNEGGKSCYVVRTCHYIRNKPTAVASFNRTEGIRNGLSSSNIEQNDGFEQFLFDSTKGNSSFLVSFDGSTNLKQP
jgi:phage tail sheath protein FI